MEEKKPYFKWNPYYAAQFGWYCDDEAAKSELQAAGLLNPGDIIYVADPAAVYTVNSKGMVVSA